MTSPIDYAPGAEGAWKTLELEINYSLVQAARASRNVVMPDYFALFDPSLPAEKGNVNTGRRVVSINKKDTQQPETGAHVFLTLGEAMHVIEALLHGQNESLDSLIRDIAGDSLSADFLERWREVAQIRNDGSHIHPLDQSECQLVMQFFADPDYLHVLKAVKEALRTRRGLRAALRGRNTQLLFVFDVRGPSVRSLFERSPLHVQWSCSMHQRPFLGTYRHHLSALL